MKSILFISMMIFTLGCGHQSLKPQPVKPKQKTLKVMTFNVNFGVPGDPESMDAIRKANADVVLLQETTAQWEKALHQNLSDVYTYRVFKHCCRAGGLGILSKHPITSKAYLEPPKPGWFPAWRAIVTTPLGPIQVLNVHLRPPLSEQGSLIDGYFSTPEVRQKEIKAYMADLEKGMPTIVAGDFNENGDGKAVKALQSLSMFSVLPQFHGNEPTWRWPTRFMTLRAQLDHIVYDQRVLHPLDARVIKAGRSDHYPVVATFTVQTPKGLKMLRAKNNSSLYN